MRRMFSATANAISESSRYHSVNAAAPTPSTTPAEVPHVRHQVMRVGFQGDGVVPLSGAGEHPGHKKIDERRRHRDGEPDPDLLDGCRIPEPLQRRPGDGERGYQDQRALETAREVLGLAVAVGVLLVGGAGGEGEHRQRHNRRSEVDQRLDRVGKQADRAGQQVRTPLQRDGRERRRDGDPRVAREGAWLRLRLSRGIRS